ncbi:MAG TPA: hypothetical protein VFN55_08870 [Solirubrobacteraceae bacterium]|nr:hypothetical protein [Solirubrobacteraceae bacterium]
MRRPAIIAAIVAAVAVFLVLSALLARALSVGGAEDAALTDLVRAEARGDTAAVIAAVTGCRAHTACRARAAALTASLQHPGQIQIAEINPSSGFALGATLGTARVAWVVGGSLPRVQCVRVRHTGNVISGFGIELLRVSLRIRSNADCPSRY